MRLKTGGLVDRETPILFRFDGQNYQGLPAIHLPQRCWPMMCAWWQGRLNITGLGVFLPPAALNQTRW